MMSTSQSLFGRQLLRVAMLCLLPLGLGSAACVGTDDPDGSLEEGTELPGDDLPVGELSDDDLKADGWGYATTCKAIPELPQLSSPRIVISIQGLTLRLTDPDTGYDKIFPIGPGVIDNDPSSSTYGESKSYFPLKSKATQDFELRPATNTACKIWWTDTETGERLPVFAGLPFLSWSGSYGIHGPIDNFRAANGGTLRRGFVSHGCIRMESADVLEVYARIRTLPRVPVHVQREPERTTEGERIDVPAPWLGSECSNDADCSFEGGICKHNRYSDRGFCTARCTKYCSDKPNGPVSYCVTDPDEPTLGMCVLKETALNQDCRPLDHFVPVVAPRHNQSSSTARVCMPGSPGWIGDHCWSDDDCATGNRCAGVGDEVPGTCTQSCVKYCPDEPGWPTTFCTSEPDFGGPSCLRQCTLGSNASECAAGSHCAERTRNGGGSSRTVCVPD